MKNLILITIFMSFGILFFSNCSKDIDKPKAVITVFDTDSLVVFYAKVRIWVENDNDNNIIDEVRYTDVHGKVYFESQYEAILDIRVEKSDASKLRIGKGVLILKEDETYYENIIIK